MLCLKNVTCIATLLIITLSFSFSNVAFFGHDITLEEVSDQNELRINANLVNREDIVKSQIQIIHEVRRIDDLSLIYEEKNKYSLAPYEVKAINDTIDLTNAASGEYYVTSQIVSGAGAPLSRASHEITINSSIEQEIKFSKLPYLRVFYDTGESVRYENSYSTTGRPIGNEEVFEVRFNVENLREVEKAVNYEFELRNSYDQEDFKEILSRNITLGPNEEEEIIEELTYDRPGTYNLFVKVYNEDNKMLANKEVRVVIVGESGTIMDVFNKQDTYNENERVELETRIVGPADSLSVVKNSDLNLEIIKEEEVVYSQLIKIDTLPINPEMYSFSFLAPEELEYYKARITLKNNGTIYDEVVLDYEPLSPDKIISPQGAVYDPSKDMCLDDGECSEKELQLGNCADCIIEENENRREELREVGDEEEERNDEVQTSENSVNNVNNANNSLIYTVSLLVSIAIACVIYVILTRTRGNEK